jgi:hypothetical protein
VALACCRRTREQRLCERSRGAAALRAEQGSSGAAVGGGPPAAVEEASCTADLPGAKVGDAVWHGKPAALEVLSTSRTAALSYPR